ncbi:MAG: PrsW family intramembrane metalloprotease [Thermodesulfobacteriota bacterium]
MDHAIIFVSLIVAVAPMVALLFFIWWVDQYDREPLKYVFASFLWGGLGAIAFSILGTEAGIRMLGGFVNSTGFDFPAVVLAPFIEEFMKGLIVFFLLRYRHFDNVTDGLVYGAASGLGFGMTENFMYFTQFAGNSPGYEWLNLLFVRSMMTANMHCAASATFGAGISKLKDGGKNAWLSVGGFYLLAVFLHATWNFLVTSRVEAYWGLAVIILFVYIVFIFVIFVKGILGERKQREVVLVEEFDLGVLPADHRKILMSYRAMRKGGWFPEYLNKDKYLSLVSRLALRKTSYYKSEGSRQAALQKEIVELRVELKRFADLLQQLQQEKAAT